jgi:hypothetical protein
MRKSLFLTAATALLSLGAAGVADAQQSYTSSFARTRALLIDWRPEQNITQRYTVSVSPLRLASNGLKFDFEYELPKAGHWLGTSLAVYAAPQRYRRYNDFWNSDGNDRSWFISGWDYYNRMWGVGTSLFFKNTLSDRGWYYSAGLVFDFFRVGITKNTYIPYEEEGLTFYDYGRALETKSYFKPTAQINVGKHVALSQRCYFDFYAGLGISYAFTKKDDMHLRDDHDSYRGWYGRLFTRMGGFAFRGIAPVVGFRFGVLLWK